MNHFVNPEETEEIKFSDGEHVMIKKDTGFYEMAETYDKDLKRAEKVLLLLKKFVVSWSFKDEKGAPIPLTDDNFKRLSSDTATILFDHITPKISVSKKKEEGSEKP